MAEQIMNSQTLAPLRNVSAFLTLVRRPQNRPHDTPGMGCFFGLSGYGKTTASIFVANHEQACVVQCKSVWTQKALCQAILAELGVTAAKTIYEMVDQIAEALAREDVPLFIDEADFLVSKKMIEIVRDIYESSLIPVVLIGEELLPQKLQKWERVHGRVLSWVAAEPADARDFYLLRQIRCPDLDIAPELQAKMREASRGSARRMVENLEAARELGRTIGRETLTLKDWGGREFYTGATPMPRRIA